MAARHNGQSANRNESRSKCAWAVRQGRATRMTQCSESDERARHPPLHEHGNSALQTNLQITNTSNWNNRFTETFLQYNIQNLKRSGF